MYADENVIKIKHDVLYEVAKLAFAGELEEKKDYIANQLIPGPAAQFGCCIYKEREIIRQRVRLAEGKAPGPVDDGNVIQVISSACEDCPISSYTVTENCQNCLGKACINACKFGAIEPGRLRSHIDPQKCKECGKCAQACPYNAIAHLKRPCKFSCPVNAITYDEYGISVIDEKKCIRCGKCIHSCPFGAIGSKTYIVNVIEALKSNKKVYAMAAPATEGQFGDDITMNSWKKAMEAVGRSLQRRQEESNFLLSCICQYGKTSFSGACRQYFYHDFPDGSSIPSDQSKRSGGSYRIYRTMYR